MEDAAEATPHRLRTAALANLAAVLERCDEQMVPAVYRFLGAAFEATPTQLGYITLSRALVQALSAPLGGVAGARSAGWRQRQGRAMRSASGAGPCRRLTAYTRPPSIRPLPAPRPRRGRGLSAVVGVHRRLCRLPLAARRRRRLGGQWAWLGARAAKHAGTLAICTFVQSSAAVARLRGLPTRRPTTHAADAPCRASPPTCFSRRSEAAPLACCT